MALHSEVTRLHCCSDDHAEMALFIWFLFIIKLVSATDKYSNNGILHHINTGMNLAKDFLGSESVALKVADFVVRAFQPPKQTLSQRPSSNLDESNENEDNYSNDQEHDINVQKQFSQQSPWRHLVRLLGLQSNQISAVAVNALIFVAQMITTFFAGPKNSNKTYRTDDPVKWILSKNSLKLQQLLATAKNDSLPELISELIKNEDTTEETSCIRLLVCKITPFVERMQKTVFEENNQEFDKNVRGARVLYRHLPTSDEFNVRSDICEQQFKECDLNE